MQSRCALFRAVLVAALAGLFFPAVAIARPGESKKLDARDRAVIKADVEAAMQGEKPVKGRNSPKTVVLPAERMVLWGHLFGDDRIWAVTETGHPDFAVAALQWKEGRWEMREVWHVSVDWVPAGTKPHDRGYYHVTPPSVPFTLKDVSGDGVPEVLVFFNNDGYRDGYQVFKWNGAKESLNLVAISEDGEPEGSEGYLVTHQSSGRKAWWGQNIYFKWIDGVPVEMVTWTEGSKDETDQGPTLFTIETSASHPAGKQHFVIPKDMVGEATQDSAGAIAVLKDGKPFAEISFQWAEGYLETQDPTVPFAAETLYLFEKLTGIPWKAYGSEINGAPLSNAKGHQSHFKVRVTGTAEGITLLSRPGK